MADFDDDLRSVARMLVADAPPPPPLSAVEAVGSGPVWRRPAAVLAVAAASAAVIAGAVWVTRDSPRQAEVRTAAGGRTPEVQDACTGPLPFAVEVPGAGDAVEGPAPGAAEPAAGQVVRHWLRPEGPVEVRWPAAPQRVYGEGAATGPVAGESIRPDATVIDVAPSTGSTADAVIRRADAAQVAEGCEVLQLSVTTSAGTWVSGLRRPTNGSQAVYEPVDLQPRIVDRRDVGVAPRQAVPCRGSDANGTPPNRAGGAQPELRGAEPADALLAFLAANPGSPQSGYVEMRAPDGSITYGADPSGGGWTTLVHVRSGSGGWHVAATHMSGC
jgi:hypothetical protein